MTVPNGFSRRISVTLLCNAFVAPSLAAQTGSVLAGLPGSARLAGMGGAGAAIVGDAGVIFTNPAGLATIHRLALEGSYEAYPSGATLSTGAMALRAGRFTWGAGAAALGQTYTSADVLGVSSLVFRTGPAAVGPPAQRHPEPRAGDVGIAIAVFDIMALGASVQNIGGDLGSGSHLPRRTRVGFTMNYVDPQGSYRLVTTLEGQWPSRGTGGGSPFLVLGVEGGVVKPGLGLLARLGYVGHSVTTAAAPFTWGGSLELGRLHLDYAYRADDTLGARQRMGLRWTP